MCKPDVDPNHAVVSKVTDRNVVEDDVSTPRKYSHAHTIPRTRLRMHAGSTPIVGREPDALASHVDGKPDNPTPIVSWGLTPAPAHNTAHNSHTTPRTPTRTHNTAHAFQCVMAGSLLETMPDVGRESKRR